MSELSRRGRRANLNAAGTIKLGMFKRMICDIRDVSPGGARIMLTEGNELPAEFKLHLPISKRPRRCVRRWQSGNEYGIEFLLD